MPLRGIWVLWDKNKVDIKIRQCLEQSITMCITCKAWMFSAVYGKPCH